MEEDEEEMTVGLGAEGATGVAVVVGAAVVGTDVDEPVAAAEGVALRLAIVAVGMNRNRVGRGEESTS